jgi:glycosyltransferase involved in cell wall biosynthesis
MSFAGSSGRKPQGVAGPRAGPAPGTAVSACIISFQEEDRIATALASLWFCDEIVVVDSRSTDRTRGIASEFGARVIERDWPGHVAQKEFAIRAARHDWVLCLDCDEELTAELTNQILEVKAAGFPGAAGYDFPRCAEYFGVWIRRGGWYPDRQLRLFDRRQGRWGGINPHDKVLLDRRPVRLSGELLHRPYRNFREQLDTLDKYTTIGATERHQRGIRARAYDLVVHPSAYFLRFYFIKRGFLDGWRGLLLATLMAHYGLLKYAKLLILQKAGSLDQPKRVTWPAPAGSPRRDLAAHPESGGPTAPAGPLPSSPSNAPSATPTSAHRE